MGANAIEPNRSMTSQHGVTAPMLSQFSIAYLQFNASIFIDCQAFVY